MSSVENRSYMREVIDRFADARERVGESVKYMFALSDERRPEWNPEAVFVGEVKIHEGTIIQTFPLNPHEFQTPPGQPKITGTSFEWDKRNVAWEKIKIINGTSIPPEQRDKGIIIKNPLIVLRRDTNGADHPWIKAKATYEGEREFRPGLHPGAIVWYTEKHDNTSVYMKLSARHVQKDPNGILSKAEINHNGQARLEDGRTLPAQEIGKVIVNTNA